MRRLRGATFAITLAASIVLSFGHTRTVNALDTCNPTIPKTCTIKDLAKRLGIRFGATLEDFEIADADYIRTLSREFSSVTPENALKMYSTQSVRGTWSFSAGDTVVNFANSSRLAIRGHTLVWAQDAFTPDWVKGITDPTELWTATVDHITEVMRHYSGRVRRWDVVNEPLATLGTGPSTSVYWSLGPNWIADTFRLAHSIDPNAELWINEYGSDWVSGKHAAYLTLVRELVDAGVPIDGVGLQLHRVPGTILDQDKLENQLRDFTQLGLRVAVTEVDVPVSPTDAKAFNRQADEYRKIVSACIAVPGCTEITVWGVTDRDTWLDGLGLFPTPTRPLLFDNQFKRKPAYIAVRNAMATEVNSRTLPASGFDATSLLSLALAAVSAGIATEIVRKTWRRRSIRGK